ncbi:hypothetical protein MesoLj113a_41790 [Mesorhizobium sp. 113-1-2]|uniref:hypothetical protein n=1 Tax=Mesorhizobium sp. 113-1-2 TaxID=2744515 RepID=UPI0008199A2E|nr:hypothetical protein [Mesorhizobium sp. 113-1-2]BAV45735.1 Uncharacterized protein MLTONO_0832 [Mesorhizobium loti]BCG73021.1 hypothetical protein MesoLj113a_41790 [Mesorhizobium sp. 113-1-2]
MFPDFGRIPAAPVEPADPLLDAIGAYRASLADYNANAPEGDAADAYAEQTYGPPMTGIEEWEAPATTHRSALEALRLAVDENEGCATNPMVAPLLAAVVAYLEGQS